MSLKRDLEFLFELGAFRHVQRTWKQFLNPDFQNNSEHSFRVAYIALMIAKYEKVVSDEKITKMALLHDLGESRTGDVHYLSRQYTDRNEKLATEDVFKDTIFGKEMTRLWEEYEDRKTIESKIVKDADNLDVELEIVEQDHRGFDFKKVWHGKQVKKKKILYTKTAKILWEKIHKANPHDWHVNGRNRFNDGDWKKLK
jgi:putative hydrolase of HD superfamily